MERATLSDVLNYLPDKYLSDEEIELLRNAFRYNPQLLKVLRKMFLPSMTDPELPNEELEADVFMKGKFWDQIPADEAKILIVARQDAVRYIMDCLVRLRSIAATDEEGAEAAKERAKKNSSK